MKHIVACPHCNKPFIMEVEDNQKFFCPNCGGANTLENAVLMEELLKVNAEMPRSNLQERRDLEWLAVKEHEKTEFWAKFIVFAVFLGVFLLFLIVATVYVWITTNNKETSMFYNNIYPYQNFLDFLQ